MTDISLDQAYRQCLALARSHYENFPVASGLLPRSYRRPVAAIYAFARTADDYADEGDLPPARRLARLDDYAARLDRLDQARDDPIFVALADTIARFGLPVALFHDLLTAFRLDVTKTRYADFAQVMDYCRYSANPVGRLLLHLFDEASPDNLRRSDAVCSALQLINFYQDLAQDFDESNRIYLPQDEMAAHGVGEDHFRERRSDAAMDALMAEQIRRARQMMLYGAPLGRRLKGRFGLELRLIIAGGLRILDALERLETDRFARPRLRRRDWLGMVTDALWRRYPETADPAVDSWTFSPDNK